MCSSASESIACHRYSRPLLCLLTAIIAVLFATLEARATEGTAQLTTLGPSEPGPGKPPGPVLMTEIAKWLSANFELPLTDDLPHVELASPTTLVAVRLGGFAIRPQETASEPNRPRPPLNIAGDLVAVYDTAKRIIYLPESWNGESHVDASILVHEMVHHLQNVGRLQHACPDAREKAAYLAQDQWLRRFGQDLETAFGIDLFTIVVRAGCFH
jgi:Domain of unknown function (DUF6647)